MAEIYLDRRPQVELLGVLAEDVPGRVDLDEVQIVLRPHDHFLKY